MRILQLNLNHCEAAQDLLCDTISRLRIDVAILCEQYKNLAPPNTWLADADGQAAIWVHGGIPVQERPARVHPYYAWARIGGIFFFSVYAPPRLFERDFSALLANITEEARGRRPLVIAGDFNAWSTEWGCRETRPRATILLDSLALLDAVLLNTGDVPTFNGRQGSSIVDLTFVCETLTPRVLSWTVSGLYTHSDHQAIVFEIEDDEASSRPSTRQSYRSNARTLDVDRFSAAVSSASVAPGTAKDMASSLMSFITGASDASMSKANPRRRREPVYWWTAEIADLRFSCQRARSLFQRSRGRHDEETHSANYASARRLLRVAIKTSKRRCWRQLCDEVNNDVWGEPYKIAMSRLGCPQAKQPSSPLLVRGAVAAQFPREPSGPRLATAASSGGAYTGFHLGGTQRSSVEDKRALRARPGWHTKLSAQDRCCRASRHLLAGVHDVPGDRRFPVQLEAPETRSAPKARQTSRRAVLVSSAVHAGHGGQDSRENHMRPAEGFHREIPRPLGATTSFPPPLRPSPARDGTRVPKKYCAVVTLDVRNAFNSARRDNVLAALRRLLVPDYLLRIITSYFSARVLDFTTDESHRGQYWARSCGTLCMTRSCASTSERRWRCSYRRFRGRHRSGGCRQASKVDRTRSERCDSTALTQLATRVNRDSAVERTRIRDSTASSKNTLRVLVQLALPSNIKESTSNKLALTTSFHEYKKSSNDTVSQHVAKIENLASQLKDIGQPVHEVMIMAKIISTLPAKYNAFISAWDSVPEADQSLDRLRERLLREETQMTSDDDVTRAFATTTISPRSNEHHHQANGKEKSEKRNSAFRKNIDREWSFIPEVGAWDSVPEADQSLDRLRERLLREETQMTSDDDVTRAFATTTISPRSNEHHHQANGKEKSEKRNSAFRKNIDREWSFIPEVGAWDSVPEADQSLDRLRERLLREETQMTSDDDVTRAFATTTISPRSNEHHHQANGKEKSEKRNSAFRKNIDREWSFIPEVGAWDSVPEADQSLDRLRERLLREETQMTSDDDVTRAFATTTISPRSNEHHHQANGKEKSEKRNSKKIPSST
ncbi:unnamed protein product [Trichogramma brassicae]|uniref:Endonuclease/exonuclease/phosphatase domain-containing protein n=1 Tax=Trichogramma brassicae TaxID=86971 RepID=A0A6H5IW56_9HYME|nr:unnamed protein product [Trichogramma brassicae]